MVILSIVELEATGRKVEVVEYAQLCYVHTSVEALVKYLATLAHTLTVCGSGFPLDVHLCSANMHSRHCAFLYLQDCEELQDARVFWP